MGESTRDVTFPVLQILGELFESLDGLRTSLGGQFLPERVGLFPFLATLQLVGELPERLSPCPPG